MADTNRIDPDHAPLGEALWREAVEDLKRLVEGRLDDIQNMLDAYAGPDPDDVLLPHAKVAMLNVAGRELDAMIGNRVGAIHLGILRRSLTRDA